MLRPIEFKDIKKGDRLYIGIAERNWSVFDRFATAMQDTLIGGWYAENPGSQYVNVRFDDPSMPYNEAPYPGTDAPHPNDTLYGPYHAGYRFQVSERGRGKGETQWTTIYKITEDKVATEIEQAQADIKAAENLLKNAQENLAKATAPKETDRDRFVKHAREIPAGSLVTFRDQSGSLSPKNYIKAEVLEGFYGQHGTVTQAGRLYELGKREIITYFVGGL